MEVSIQADQCPPCVIPARAFVGRGSGLLYRYLLFSTAERLLPDKLRRVMAADIAAVQDQVTESVMWLSG